jgi:hypothetical protein
MVSTEAAAAEWIFPLRGPQRQVFVVGWKKNPPPRLSKVHSISEIALAAGMSAASGGTIDRKSE